MVAETIAPTLLDWVDESVPAQFDGIGGAAVWRYLKRKPSWEQLVEASGCKEVSIALINATGAVSSVKPIVCSTPDVWNSIVRLFEHHIPIWVRFCLPLPSPSSQSRPVEVQATKAVHSIDVPIFLEESEKPKEKVSEICTMNPMFDDQCKNINDSHIKNDDVSFTWRQTSSFADD